MRTKKPTFSLIQDPCKIKKDGTSPVFILICWRGRKKESTGVCMTPDEFKEAKKNNSFDGRIKKRLDELEKVADIVYLRKNLCPTVNEFVKYKLDDVNMVGPYKKKKQYKRKKPYKVYMHVLPDNTIYIGCTGRTLKKRWDNGRGYIKNNDFYFRILKFGWDNIGHLLIKDDMDRGEAYSLEKSLIRFYAQNEELMGKKILNKFVYSTPD